MKPSSLTDWFQITASAAVFVGLVFVVVEMRQAKALAQAQIVSDNYSDMLENYRGQWGENPAEVFSKACVAPEQLDAAELLILHSYYRSKYALVQRQLVLETIADFGIPWQQVHAANLADIVSSEPGRVWYAQAKATFEPEVAELTDQILKSGAVGDCADFLQSLRAGLDAGVATIEDG